MNELNLINTLQGWIAVYSGETGMGEIVENEEAHNIAGDDEEERILNALLVWGVNRDDVTVNIHE